jgi:hypothetical protein
MASRVSEVIYKLRDLFTGPVEKIKSGYRDIRKESRSTADSVENDTSRMGRGLGSFVGALGRARAALLTIGASAGGVTGINSVANELDRLGKTAARLDIDPGLLAAYGFAAERSGVQVGVMEKALADLQRRVGEAALGLGEAKVAFERLGIDAENFQNLGLEKQMAILADRLSSVASEEERAALAAKLFGEAGVQLLQTLNGGSAALAELVRQGREYTGVTKEQTQAAAEYNDALATLGATLDGAKFRVGGGALQSIVQFAGSFGLLSNEAANLKAQLEDARRTLEGWETSIAPNARALDQARARFELLSEAVAEIEERGQDPVLVGLRTELALLNDELAETRTNAFSPIFNLLGDSASDTVDRIIELERAIEGYSEAQAESAETTKKELAAAAAKRAEDEKDLAAIEALKKAQESRKKVAEEAYKAETAELRSARQEQLAIEREFAKLRKEITAPDKDTSLVDVALKQRQASAALGRGETEKAIELSREGADLLSRLKDQSGQSSVALGFFAKQLEKVANQAAAQNVEKELLDAEKVKAEVLDATAALGSITDAMKDKGAEAARAFLEAFAAQMQTTTLPAPNIAQPTVPEPRIVRDGNSFSTSVREELDRRGYK